MSQPPRIALPPLTSSLLPQVGQALQRRVEGRSVREDHNEAASNIPVLRGMFDGRVDDDDDGPLSLDEMPQRASTSPAHRPRTNALGLPEDGAPRTYTLGQIVEALNSRRASRRQIVESGDVDGPEEPINPRTLLGQAVKAMQGG